MNKPSTKIHIERSEFLVIAGIVFLFAGLMFSLGVMVGAGLNGGHEVIAENDDAGDETSAHGSVEKSHKNHKSEGSRKIASVDSPGKNSAHARDSEERMPGKGLREAYRKAKQTEFEDMLTADSDADAGPLSVQDSKAYFDSREKVKDEEKDLPLETNFSGMVEDREPASDDENKAPPPVVKALFERKPAGVNDYSPVFGEYTVLVASYSTEDEATSKLAGLRAAGFDDAYFKKEKSKTDNGEWFRVGVGSYKDMKWALKTKETLRKKTLAMTPIVKKVD